jgi:predicted ATP-dependent endonuclease of OLD family
MSAEPTACGHTALGGEANKPTEFRTPICSGGAQDVRKVLEASASPHTVRSMRLVSAYCKGYRRFHDTAEMNLDPRLVCIVGPNAAGKSSFLKALTRLNQEFEGIDFDAVDHTRSHPGEDIEVSARYELDAKDRAQVAEVPEARNATHLTVRKVSGRSDRIFDLEPVPLRTRKPRADLARRLTTFRKSKWVSNRVAQEASDGSEVTDALLARIASDLTADVDDLIDETKADLGELSSRLDTASESAVQARQLQKAVTTLIDTESTEHPHDQAVRRLIDRVPQFVEFREDLRQLAAVYNVDEEPDQAIHNVLELAGTSWNELVNAVNSDAGRQKTWTDRAEAAAQARLAEWRQQGGELKLSFNIDGRALTLLMKMTDGEYIAVDQQSDGLRQFVALRALIARQGFAVDPVVLIDEAETHLHYDAQANLVRVLESAEGVSTVIYTTHSAGCLPHDLGTGLRAVVPILDSERKLTDFSRIEGRFWTHGEGFSPLLIAMGASAFAFSATQRALVTEGISDAMLLPSMIREATNLDRLPYQIVPGFAEARGDATPEFDLMASRTAFVADGDAGGDEHARKLMNNGVSKKQVVYLGGQGNGFSTEDLLVRGVYLAAVNDVLDGLSGGLKVPDAEVGANGRANAVKKWAETRGVDGKPLKVRKAAVAQRVLDNRTAGAALVSPASRKALRRLHTAILKVLDKPTQKL